MCTCFVLEHTGYSGCHADLAKKYFQLRCITLSSSTAAALASHRPYPEHSADSRGISRAVDESSTRRQCHHSLWYAVILRSSTILVRISFLSHFPSSHHRKYSQSLYRPVPKVVLTSLRTTHRGPGPGDFRRFHISIPQFIPASPNSACWG